MGLTEEDLARLKAEGHYTSTNPVVSPLDGVVVERSASLGQMVQPQDTLFVVMDLRQVWVLVDVYEQDLGHVKVGQVARARVASSDKPFTGAVTNIGAVVEPKSRAVKVRVVLPNPEGDLKPGMFARVELSGAAGAKREGVYIPAAAIQRDGPESIVFVPRGTGQFERRAVKIARSAGDVVEIGEGLAEGETVVTTGSFLLKSQLKKGELGEGAE